jgi:hypothetical protein
VQDRRLPGLDEPQRGQVPDLGGGDLRAVGEVEVLDGRELLEAGGPDSAVDAGGVPATQLVLAQPLEELHLPELAGVSLGQAGLDGLEHPRQPQGRKGHLQLMGPHPPPPLRPGDRTG